MLYRGRKGRAQEIAKDITDAVDKASNVVPEIGEADVWERKE
jgi:hypothetical protein